MKKLILILLTVSVVPVISAAQCRDYDDAIAEVSFQNVKLEQLEHQISLAVDKRSTTSDLLDLIDAMDLKNEKTLKLRDRNTDNFQFQQSVVDYLFNQRVQREEILNRARETVKQHQRACGHSGPSMSPPMAGRVGY